MNAGPVQALPPWAGAPLPAIATPRLLLRAMGDGDLAALFAIYGDPEVMRHASDPVFTEPATVQTLLASVARLQAAGLSLEWAIERRADGAVIGTCGLHGFDEDAAAAEMGCLLRRDAWGQGHAREALQALMDFACARLQRRALRAEIDADNIRSKRLFAALGFTRRDATHWVHSLAG